MKRINSKSARIVAFVAALGASAALVGTAASATGAYFTDSKTGNLTATAGHLRLNQIGDYNLSMANLIPGEYQDKTVTYSTDTNTPEDIWLVFDPTTPGYKAFTGGGSTASDSGLGRYGHFAVKSDDGSLLFSSWNLRDAADGSSGCADANGHGSNSPATSPTDSQNGYCGVPQYMLVESNVPNGATKQFTMTFGLTGKAQGGQDAQWANVPFKVVATQHGIRPDAQNF